ncbi:YraN family protein [Paenibacillus hexagrammi]|uniref:UPF0102 protein L0M14_09585 n=1 Tax=Paenibacillus hexagrammi TaxID=2908839 RepID=A0ABY3SN44_9BACL|nr:YraN family protein [Paenibacillus sp. YPD9-1]UJF35328.1 YraN family protein [Paenibacillus sp. YPD9-1]
MTIERKDRRKELGAAGEEMAVQLLTDKGYTISSRNWRCRVGEIDIVAESEGVLVFVEVRTRNSSRSFGMAKESVDYRKQMKVREAAQYYLARYKLYDRRVRFDVLSIQMNQMHDRPLIEHIEGAF